MYTVVYPGGITLRSEPKFESKITGRVARRGDVIEAKRTLGDSWIQLKDNTYLPINGPNQETLLQRDSRSDDKTTTYMKRFKEGLETLGMADDDAYITQYTNVARSKLLKPVPPMTGTPILRDESRSKSLQRELSVSSKVNVSDRNVLCMSLYGDEAVVGTADHALYAVNLQRNKISRKLYTKSSGHSEWVSCVTHEQSTGRVLSGGMDGKICLWDGAVARDLQGHLGSVSRLHERSGVLLSSSYDRSLKCWDLRRRELLADFQGHKGAVLDFYVHQETMLSCGRDSLAILWDIKAAKETCRFKDHSGHVTAGLLSESIALTGAQDGKVRIWDFRTPVPALIIDLHRKGAAITGLEQNTLGGGEIVSCGADGRVNIFDLREPEKTLVQWDDDHENFIYCMRLIDGDVFTGGGDGTLVRRSLDGELKFRVSVEANAIRCIEKWNSKVVVAGDDGNLVILN